MMHHIRARLKEGDVMLFDLVSGIEVTAEVKELHDDHVVVGKMLVFQIGLQPGPDGQPVQQVSVMPFGSPFAVTQQPTETPISYDHITFVHEPKSEVEKAYRQAATGIQIAGAGALNDLDSKNPGIATR